MITDWDRIVKAKLTKLSSASGETSFDKGGISIWLSFEKGGRMQITGFKDAIGVSRQDIENWLPKLDSSMSTLYAPTAPGVPREFSRDNVLELAVIAAIKKAGCPSVRTAAAWAASVIRNDRAGKLYPWLAFPARDFTQAAGQDNPSK